MKRGTASGLSILGKLILLSAVSVLSLAILAAVSGRAFGLFSASLEDVYAVRGGLTRTSLQIELHAYAAQVDMYKLINYGSQGYGSALLQTLIAGIKKNIADGNSLLSSLQSLKGASQE